MFRNRRIIVQIYNYIYVPSLLCAEMVWAEMVMCRVGYVPSLLCAEFTRHRLFSLGILVKAVDANLF